MDRLQNIAKQLHCLKEKIFRRKQLPLFRRKTMAIRVGKEKLVAFLFIE